jgi:hypothetical protein
LIIGRESLTLIITPSLALGAVKSCSVLLKQGSGRIINSPARTNYLTVCSSCAACQPCCGRSLLDHLLFPLTTGKNKLKKGEKKINENATKRLWIVSTWYRVPLTCSYGVQTASHVLDHHHLRGPIAQGPLLRTHGQ